MKFISICIISLSIGAAYGLVAAPRKLMARDAQPNEEQLVEARRQSTKLQESKNPIKKVVPIIPDLSKPGIGMTAAQQEKVNKIVSKITQTESKLQQLKKDYRTLTGISYTEKGSKGSKGSQLQQTHVTTDPIRSIDESKNTKTNPKLKGVNVSDNPWRPGTMAETNKGD